MGIAAVLLSPLTARALEATEAQPSDGDVTTQAPHAAAPHAASPKHKHKGEVAADKKSRKRAHHKDAGKADAPKGDAVAKEKAKPSVDHEDEAVAVKTERASAKTPKQSSAPLATLAAAVTKPLDEPEETKAAPAKCEQPKAEPSEKAARAQKLEHAKKGAHATAEVAEAKVHASTIEPKGHAVEPRRSPIVRASHAASITRASSHTRDSDADAEPAPSHAAKHTKSACLHAPISVSRGTEEETFAFTKCDGTVAPNAVEEMSILVRPGSAAKPGNGSGELLAKKGESPKDSELGAGIKRIDPRLVERLQLVVDHFAKPSATPKLFIVSGYRPASKGSFHAMGRAIDFRMDGVSDTDLVAFCKTMPDTGCGFYPNSSFIHLDVRESGTGKVAWIDASAPGEKPDYVASWPLPAPSDEEAVKALAHLDELQILPPAGAGEDKTEESEDAKADGEAKEPKLKESTVSLKQKRDDGDDDKDSDSAR